MPKKPVRLDTFHTTFENNKAYLDLLVSTVVSTVSCVDFDTALEYANNEPTPESTYAPTQRERDAIVELALDNPRVRDALRQFVMGVDDAVARVVSGRCRR